MSSRPSTTSRCCRCTPPPAPPSSCCCVDLAVGRRTAGAAGRRAGASPPRAATVAVRGPAVGSRSGGPGDVLPACRSAATVVLPTAPGSATAVRRRDRGPLRRADRSACSALSAPLLRRRRRPGRGVLLPAGLLDDRRRGARLRRRPDHPDRRPGDADPAALRPGRAAPAPRQPSPAGAEAAVTFFVVSVVSTAVTLLGAALLYAVDRRRAPDRLLPRSPEPLHPARRRSAAALVAGRAGVQGRRRAVPRLGAGHLRRRAAADRRLPVDRLQAGRRRGACWPSSPGAAVATSPARCWPCSPCSP